MSAEKEALISLLIDQELEEARQNLSDEEYEEMEEYVLSYTRNTPEEQQSAEDFADYIESFWRNR